MNGITLYSYIYYQSYVGYNYTAYACKLLGHVQCCH